MSKRSALLPSTASEQEILGRAAKKYHEALTEDVGEYLTGPERMLDIETVVGRQLGVVTDPEPGHEHLEGWISIPYLGPNDEVLKIRFRRPPGSDSRAKYKDLPHAQPRMYNARTVLTAGDFICLTEGEADAMVLEQIGLPAVALPGGTTWLPHYSKILAGFDKVWLFGDPDDTGRKMNAEVASHLRQAEAVKLSFGDVTAEYAEFGPDHIKSLIGMN